jgi:heme/copper-type cytochrome/quinol oxidase subunit 4
MVSDIFRDTALIITVLSIPLAIFALIVLVMTVTKNQKWKDNKWNLRVLTLLFIGITTIIIVFMYMDSRKSDEFFIKVFNENFGILDIDELIEIDGYVSGWGYQTCIIKMTQNGYKDLKDSFIKNETILVAEYIPTSKYQKHLYDKFNLNDLDLKLLLVDNSEGSHLGFFDEQNLIYFQNIE